MTDWRDDLRYYKIPSVTPWLHDPATAWIRGVQYLLAAHRQLGGNMCDVTLDRAMQKRSRLKAKKLRCGRKDAK